jgi:anti-sigma B factor antagonist
MDASKKPDPYGVEQKAAAAAAAGGAPDAGAGQSSSLFSSSVVEGGIHVITFSRSDVLDAHYIQQLGNDLGQFVGSINEPRVLVDMESVHFLSSAALGMLIGLNNKVAGSRGKMCIANLRDELREVFKITKLHKVLDLQKNTEKALARLS